MILTVTLNPAVDRTYTADNLVIGAVNRMSSVNCFAGGKGVNVTKILRQFDYSVTATGFLGGANGAFIENDLLRRGAKCEFVHIENETRGNMNIISSDKNVTEILEPGAGVSEQETTDFIERFKGLCQGFKVVIMSGSVPTGVPKDIYKTLIEIAKEESVPVFLDTSGEWLLEGIKAKPYLIKPNINELRDIINTKEKIFLSKSFSELTTSDCNENILYNVICRNGVNLNSIEYTNTIHSILGIEQIVVSNGAEGIVWAGKDQRPPKINAVNTVGCGDTAVASLAMSYIKTGFRQREDIKEALLDAVIMSAAGASILESGSVPTDVYNELRQAEGLTSMHV